LAAAPASSRSGRGAFVEAAAGYRDGDGDGGVFQMDEDLLLLTPLGLSPARGAAAPEADTYIPVFDARAVARQYNYRRNNRAPPQPWPPRRRIVGFGA
jgi:hypothetical protein